MATIQEIPTEVSMMKKTIVDTINRNYCMKGVDLVLHVMSEIGPNHFEEHEYVLALSELINSGDIIELEYVVPQMNYRIKSMYFPKGTKVNVAHKIEISSIDDGSAATLPRI